MIEGQRRLERKAGQFLEEMRTANAGCEKADTPGKRFPKSVAGLLIRHHKAPVLGVAPPPHSRSPSLLRRQIRSKGKGVSSQGIDSRKNWSKSRMKPLQLQRYRCQMRRRLFLFTVMLMPWISPRSYPSSSRLPLAAIVLTILFVSLSPAAFAQALPGDVLTQKNDISRSGAQLSETTLTPANVTPKTFGRLYARAVNGQIIAQPLYASQVYIPNVGATKNVVYVATRANTVYAFDADSTDTTPTGGQLWSAPVTVQAAGPVPGMCSVYRRTDWHHQHAGDRSLDQHHVSHGAPLRRHDLARSRSISPRARRPAPAPFKSPPPSMACRSTRASKSSAPACCCRMASSSSASRPSTATTPAGTAGCSPIASPTSPRSASSPPPPAPDLAAASGRAARDWSATGPATSISRPAMAR